MPYAAMPRPLAQQGRTNGPDQRVYAKATKGETNVIQRSVSLTSRTPWVSEGIRKEKATGPVTFYGKPYDLGKIRRGS
jgi:hypothetical protein